MKEQAGSMGTGMEGGPRRRQTGKANENQNRRNPGPGKKISGNGRERQEERRRLPKKTFAPGSDRGRYRAGSFELDRNSSVAIAGKRARKITAARRTFALARFRAKRRDPIRPESCAFGP